MVQELSQTLFIRDSNACHKINRISTSDGHAFYSHEC